MRNLRNLIESIVLVMASIGVPAFLFGVMADNNGASMVYGLYYWIAVVVISVVLFAIREYLERR